LFDRLFIPST